MSSSSIRAISASELSRGRQESIHWPMMPTERLCIHTSMDSVTVRVHQTRILATAAQHCMSPFSNLSPLSTIQWCSENFVMTSLTVYELGYRVDRQTDCTDRQTDITENNTTNENNNLHVAIIGTLPGTITDITWLGRSEKFGRFFAPSEFDCKYLRNGLRYPNQKGTFSRSIPHAF